MLAYVLGVLCTGTTYYVAKDGSNVAPYSSRREAATNLKIVVDYIRSVGGPGSTIYIGPGEWGPTDQMYFDHGNHSGTTVIGAGRTSTIIAPASHAIYGDVADDVVVCDLSLIVGGASYALYKRNGCDGWVIRDLDIVSRPDHQTGLLRLRGNHTDFTRCRFFHTATDEGCAAYLSSDSATTFAYCLFAPAPHSSWVGYVVCAGDQANFINCDIFGFAAYGIIASRGTTNVMNTIVAGSGIQYSGDAPVKGEMGATLSVCNCLLMWNIWDGDADPVGGTVATDLNNIKMSTVPGFRRHARKGYILPCVDDSTSFNYARSVEPLLAKYGMRGTYYLTKCSWDNRNAEALRSMVAGGTMEVGCHAYSHSPLICTSAVLVDYQGSDTGPTVDFTPGGIIQLRTVEGTDNHDIDTGNSNCDTVGEIVALSGIKHWVITKALTDGIGLRDACLASSMAIQAAMPAPCTIALDTCGYHAGFFKNEITDPKKWMTDSLINGNGDIIDGQTGKTYVCRTFAPPFGPQTVASRQACIDAGYLLSRGSPPIDVARRAPMKGVALVDGDLYGIRFFWGYGCLNGTEAQVRSSARALAYGAIEAGLAVPVLAHNTDEMTLQEWEWCLDECSKFGDDLVITSHQLFADTIRAPEGPWTDNGDGTYSRVYDDWSDYHLAASSPCIDTGFNVGRGYALDFDGVDQDAWGQWEIGAFVHEEDMPALVD